MVIIIDDEPTTIGGTVHTPNREGGLRNRHGSRRQEVIPTAPLNHTGVFGIALCNSGLLQGKQLAIWGAGEPTEGQHPAISVNLDIEQRSWGCRNLGQDGSRVGSKRPACERGLAGSERFAPRGMDLQEHEVGVLSAVSNVAHSYCTPRSQQKEGADERRLGNREK